MTPIDVHTRPSGLPLSLSDATAGPSACARWLVVIRGGPWYNPTPAGFLGGGAEAYIARHFVTTFRTPTYLVDRKSGPAP